MNGPVGPGGVKRVICEPFIFILMTRLSVGPVLGVLHSHWKGKYVFFPPPSDRICAGMTLFHRFIPTFFFSFFSATLTFSYIRHRHLSSVRLQVHGSKSDKLLTCVALGLSNTLQSRGLPPTVSKQRKLKLRRFKLELSEFLLSW